MSRKFLELRQNFVEIYRKFLEISTNFLDISRIFLEISENFVEISRKFLPVPGEDRAHRGEGDGALGRRWGNFQR